MAAGEEETGAETEDAAETETAAHTQTLRRLGPRTRRERGRARPSRLPLPVVRGMEQDRSAVVAAKAAAAQVATESGNPLHKGPL